ncbi:MAG: RNA recognition motif-containing protein [Piccolia ochrophora]|nr:MAG: RNA recognition motif-containing protein [Piccolia ochrophora]
MSSRRKRQKLSLEGTAVVTAVNEDTDALETNATSPEPEKEPQHSKQLFVRSLPPGATSEQLATFFSELYPLKHATVVIDPATAKSKGYGFVTFADPEDAQKAIEEFNGASFEGRKIKVELAKSRHRQQDAEETLHDSKGDLGGAVPSRIKESDRQEDSRVPPPKLIVRNLPWSIKEPEQLEMLFRSYGKVKHATIPKKKSGLMSGFGFVLLRGRKNAEKAIVGVNGKTINGRKLEVSWAVDKSIYDARVAGDEASGDPETQARDDTFDEFGRDLNMRDAVDDEGQRSDEETLTTDEENAANSESLLGDSGGSGSESGDTEAASSKQDTSTTLFVRNLPFSITDESLLEHFKQFGAVRYARIVLDHNTERPKGTGFVCFYDKSNADNCLRGAPLQNPQALSHATKKSDVVPIVKHSVLENDLADPEGQYTVEGRVLQISKAVDRTEAAKLTEEGLASRDRRDRDKRRLYLLSEGTIPSESPVYGLLAPSELKMREASAKQRKTLVQNNPSLHLSLTRLSIRNIPRGVTSKQLKALAREAVVGFATDVKKGRRQPLSKEETNRGGEEMKMADKARKMKGKGIVKQATVVFEGREGGKVTEASGAGRSRGYGFLEYETHRWALMGLRWLNGHAVASPSQADGATSASRPEEKKSKRLIVEFAIENAQVIARRKEREAKDRERPQPAATSRAGKTSSEHHDRSTSGSKRYVGKGTKRKGTRDGDATSTAASSHNTPSKPGSKLTKENQDQDKLAERQRIIGRKRLQRRSRRAAAGP